MSESNPTNKLEEEGVSKAMDNPQIAKLKKFGRMILGLGVFGFSLYTMFYVLKTSELGSTMWLYGIKCLTSFLIVLFLIQKLVDLNEKSLMKEQ